MPRKKLIRTDQFFYHVTTRANNREWFRIAMNDVWNISTDAFNKAQKNSPAIVSQYVLMSNHYHLLIRTPNNDIDRFMYFFNKTFSEKLRFQSGCENRMFGSNYKWSLIQNFSYFQNVYRYIYQNPMRANLVLRCEDYPFSSLYYTHRSIELPFKFQPLKHLEKDIAFINHRQSQEHIQAIRKGLHKSIFKEVRPRSG